MASNQRCDEYSSKDQENDEREFNQHLRDAIPSINQNTSDDIQYSVENYLKSLTINEEPVNPKIRKQQKQLEELLDSYKRLCEKLDKKCKAKEEEFQPIDVRPIRPEIHALLHPELYKDIREDEKNKLRTKFSTKRIFTECEKVLPPPRTVTPTRTISDERQIEKERFCRLIASAPSRFHNVIDASPRKSKKFVTYTPQRTENVRETEKERLARIFATSSVFLKNPSLQKKILGKSLLKSYSNHSPRLCNDVVDHSVNQPKLNIKNGDTESQEINVDMCKRSDVINQENINPQIGKDPNEMVRMGDYSPLNKNYTSRGRTVLGVGEHEERKKMLDAERHNEYVDHMARATQSKFDKAVMVREREMNTRVSSASTQTDDSISDETSEHNNQINTPSPTSSPSKINPTTEYSPRQKLISDLYGSPYLNEYRPTNYLEIMQEERRKQIEYAHALKQQIAEKKRLDEERKRREREDEEMIDKRAQEQSRKLEIEFAREQNQKLDWIQQRQAQEEILRRKLLEMSLEAKDLKKQERLKKIQMEKRTQVPATSTTALTTNKSPPRRYAKPPANSPQEEARRVLAEFEERPVRAIRKENPMSLPEQLPNPNWEERPERFTENLQGVDLLREYRSQKERLQLPPLVDRASSKSVLSDRGGPSAEDILRAPLDGYIPSGARDEQRRSKSVNSYRRQAEEILRAPDDAAISSPRMEIQRPPSPVIPAVRSETVLKHNSRILDDKWQVPPPRGLELERTVNHENVLSQLGAFRRQLAREHQRLEQRLEHRS